MISFSVPGGLPREGVGVEKFIPFLESAREGTRDVPGILPGCPGPLGVFKKFVHKEFVLL